MTSSIVARVTRTVSGSRMKLRTTAGRIEVRPGPAPAGRQPPELHAEEAGSAGSRAGNWAPPAPPPRGPGRRSRPAGRGGARRRRPGARPDRTESARLPPASSSVAGSRSRMMGRMGCSNRSDRPKSPTRMPPTKARYCAGSGRSRPCRRWNSRTASGLASSPEDQPRGIAGQPKEAEGAERDPDPHERQADHAREKVPRHPRVRSLTRARAAPARVVTATPR